MLIIEGTCTYCVKHASSHNKSEAVMDTRIYALACFDTNTCCMNAYEHIFIHLHTICHTRKKCNALFLLFYTRKEVYVYVNIVAHCSHTYMHMHKVYVFFSFLR